MTSTTTEVTTKVTLQPVPITGYDWTTTVWPKGDDMGYYDEPIGPVNGKGGPKEVNHGDELGTAIMYLWKGMRRERSVTLAGTDPKTGIRHQLDLFAMNVDGEYDGHEPRRSFREAGADRDNLLDPYHNEFDMLGTCDDMYDDLREFVESYHGAISNEWKTVPVVTDD